MSPFAAATGATSELDDKRIKSVRPLIPPQLLIEEYPLNLRAAATVLDGRKGCEEIVQGRDDRLIVVSAAIIRESM